MQLTACRMYCLKPVFYATLVAIPQAGTIRISLCGNGDCISFFGFQRPVKRLYQLRHANKHKHMLVCLVRESDIDVSHFHSEALLTGWRGGRGGNCVSCCCPLANSRGQIRTTHERNTCFYFYMYIYLCIFYIFTLVYTYIYIYLHIYIFMWQVVGKWWCGA